MFAYRFYTLGSSLRRRLARRLTPAGWLVLTGVILSGAVGVDLDQSVASQTFAVLVCVLTVAIFWAVLFRGRFVVQRALPRFGSVGQPFVYRVSVRNPDGKTWRELDIFEDFAETAPTKAEFMKPWRTAGSRSFRLEKPAYPIINRPQAVVNPSSVPLLLPRGEAELRMEAMPQKRGPLRFAGATVGHRDPFGLCRGFVRVPLPQTVVILPKRYSLPAIALPGAHKYQQGGVAFAASVGESEEFIAVRDYRPGDPLRHVHWRSSARTGRLVVKEFQDEFFVRHALILDTFGKAEQAEAFEEAVSLAASFACTVDTQESLLDLMFVGAQAVCFTTGRGVTHVEQALEILASVELCSSTTFAALQNLVLQHASALSGCICIFLSWDEARRDLVQKLTVLGLPPLVLVVTDEEGAEQLASLPDNKLPDNSLVLVVGRIQEGLHALERLAV